MIDGTKPLGSANRWGPLWGARGEDWRAIEEQQIPTYMAALDRVPIKSGDRVLDIGCGAGVFLRLAAERGAKVYGLDAASGLLDQARSVVPNADLRQGEMEALPFEDDTFDLVTGFNSFFYASNMVQALREAGRVAKPRAPIVIQIWGRPENCNLDAMKHALMRFFPPPDPNAPAPPKLFEEGVLEDMARAAGLDPIDRFESSWAFVFPDEDSAARRLLAPGIVVEAVQVAGEDAVRTALLDAVAPFKTPDGYRLQNEWHYVVALAPP
ncbi:MAG: class I SAM-dependent methyltransferase [Fimbriimonadales bacterium]|nr:class I SAM-dependent methyltransferase [Fimbriimonadales bacterium]